MPHRWITKRPIAHRGYHDMNNAVWENTPSAFARAIDADFPIECDLQLSSDDVAIVFHDYDTKRLCGVDGTVREMTAEALTALHIGGTKDSVPTFRQLLEQVGGRVGLVVEIKSPAPEDIEAFTNAVLHDLEGYDGAVVLMSFDTALLEALADSGTKWPIGLVAAEFNEAERRKNEAALKLPISFISFCVDHVPSDFITLARDKGLTVISWTVRDAASEKIAAEHTDQITFEGFDPMDLSAGSEALDKAND
ncbi:glycerophosphodiester phosphodiesterase family protein [Hoeflea poritis]|uniref:Glycerophosphodiester phosphodiesterase family protein n=1 Tax=Hoeflea poritis TaxID=2993659 RepID=A0ABT4VGZ7_9HYPH|nr:glycerophosphodiester phosphodiesterase family protein [Hoeflea poritis]MDA4843955.1 glycerophosphodiester phosphodiesterase family protein [Hoeflea poritis]